MSIKKVNRTVNKKLILALIAYSGLDLAKLGKLCDPPVTNAAISMLLSGKPQYQSRRLIEQVSEIFNVRSEILFPLKSVTKPVKLAVYDDMRSKFPVVHEYICIPINGNNLIDRLIEQMASFFKKQTMRAEILFPYEAGDA